MSQASTQEIITYCGQHNIIIGPDSPIIYAQKDNRGMSAAFGVIGELASSRYFAIVFAPKQLILVRMTIGGKINTENDPLVYDPATTTITMKRMLFGQAYKTLISTSDGGKFRLLATNNLSKSFLALGYTRAGEVKQRFGFADK